MLAPRLATEQSRLPGILAPEFLALEVGEALADGGEVLVEFLLGHPGAIVGDGDGVPGAIETDVYARSVEVRVLIAPDDAGRGHSGSSPGWRHQARRRCFRPTCGAGRGG